MQSPRADITAEMFAVMLREIRRFVRSEVVPLEAQIDETDEIPERIREQAAELGLFGFALPAEHGGIGLTAEQEVQLVFELGWTTPAFRSMIGTNNGIAGHVLVLGGTPEQQRTLLPPLASGELTAAFALTEPEAGSSPADLTTSARRDAATGGCSTAPSASSPTRRWRACSWCLRAVPARPALLTGSLRSRSPQTRRG